MARHWSWTLALWPFQPPARQCISALYKIACVMPSVFRGWVPTFCTQAKRKRERGSSCPAAITPHCFFLCSHSTSCPSRKGKQMHQCDVTVQICELGEDSKKRINSTPQRSLTMVDFFFLHFHTKLSILPFTSVHIYEYSSGSAAIC